MLPSFARGLPLPALFCSLLIQAAGAETFTNPVARHGADPWVTQWDGMFYYVSSGRGGVCVTGSPSLVGVFAEPPGEPVFRPPAGTDHSHSLWAPELHHIAGAWYIYVAANDGTLEHHRMHVLKRPADDPRGPFEYVGKLALPDDKWAIDGTTAEINGKLYHIWSGWPGDVNGVQNLYICGLASPTQAVGPRVLISMPEYDWETVGSPRVNEGPAVFEHDGRTFLIYAASGSWTDSYCIGLMELTGDDPLDPDAWHKFERPWFAGDDHTISPGHASVTRSPDGTQWWLVYHSARYPGAGWNRQVNLQPFHFDPQTGLPVIGTPIPKGVPQEMPSGERAGNGRHRRQE